MKKLYQQRWWTRIFKKGIKGKTATNLDNIKAIIEFLDDAHLEINTLKQLLRPLEELEKEREMATEGLVQVNLQTQAGILDKIIGQYEFFQNDADINGIRVKRIAAAFLNHAQEAGLNDLIKEKQKDKKWAEGW